MKPSDGDLAVFSSYVALRRGAWIETEYDPENLQESIVAPRRGAWIETGRTYETAKKVWVAPRRGAWIETLCRSQ